MSMRAMIYAIGQQAIDASWRGPTPGSGAQITPAYCAELVNGLPRLQYGEGEPNQLNIPQLAADYDTALAYIAGMVADEQQRKDESSAIKADPALRQLINASPAQIDAYITSHVTDLQSARAVLAMLAKAVSVIARNQFAD